MTNMFNNKGVQLNSNPYKSYIQFLEYTISKKIHSPLCYLSITLQVRLVKMYILITLNNSTISMHLIVISMQYFMELNLSSH